MSQLDDAIADFKRAENRLNQITSQVFPLGSVVRTACGNQGIVAGVAHEIVQVLFESGNVWDRHASSLTVLTNRNEWVSWVKRAKRNRCYSVIFRRVR